MDLKNIKWLLPIMVGMIGICIQTIALAQDEPVHSTKLLSAEKKENALASFQPKENNTDKRVELSIADEDQTEISLEDSGAWASGYRSKFPRKERFFVNGNNYVEILYLNDSNFPEKYYGYSHYIENESVVFADQMDSIIFSHYLGNDYETLSPIIDGVATRVVTIRVKANDISILEGLLGSDKIVRVTHADNGTELQEILP